MACLPTSKNCLYRGFNSGFPSGSPTRDMEIVIHVNSAISKGSSIVWEFRNFEKMLICEVVGVCRISAPARLLRSITSQGNMYFKQPPFCSFRFPFGFPF